MSTRIHELEVLVQAITLEKEELMKDKTDSLEKLRLQVYNSLQLLIYIKITFVNGVNNLLFTNFKA